MNTAELLERIQTAHERWSRALARISPAALVQPLNEHGWTVKDLIAHTTWYEREMAEMLERRVLAGSDWWMKPVEDRNRLIFVASHQRPASDILADAEKVYQAFLAAVASTSSDALNDPSAFRHMPADWVPWQVIAGNSFEHYPEHTAQVEAWLARTIANTP